VAGGKLGTGLVTLDSSALIALLNPSDPDNPL
jgi:hypothetical protein